MTWLLVVTLILNVILLAAVIILWKRSFGSPKDDPRLSRGLQLLQSKISVLEDLSDRTDRQVKQLIDLMESKTRQIQKKINHSDQQIQKIDQSMRKSLEVANIFQDKIPHEEIIKRQTSAKYIQAAQLAHKGKTVDEIVDIVGLPKGEVEFISKVNRKELVFDEDQLPAWASTWNGDKSDGYFDRYSVDKLAGQKADLAYKEAFEVPQVDMSHLEKIGVEFKESCRAADESEKERSENSLQKVKENIISQAEKGAKSITKMLNEAIGESDDKVSLKAEPSDQAEPVTDAIEAVSTPPKEETREPLKTTVAQPTEPNIRPVEFPVIDSKDI
ncbi:MAG: hypothetical protein CL677_05080 [Bdellovibrionaceae bacterium]|nr:hypothetical protein [Pseudobdellovibrionaceae bacterium]|tara:strand:+ start:98707 stop:99696 length:990 start_codon:yes stop_codon:yes gene_type:complete